MMDLEDRKSSDQRLKHSKDHFSSKSGLWTILLFVTATLSCLAFYNSTYRYQYCYLNSYDQLPTTEKASSTTHSLQGRLPSSVNVEENEETKLKRVLDNAAMADKTVIITTLNAAWAAPNSVFDLFLESFRIGIGTKALLNHLVVVAVDQKAYSHCMEVHQHCYALNTEGVDFSGEAFYMSSDFLKMVWRRIGFLRTVLEMGYNFIFTDTDIVWFRDPFPRFYPNIDIQFSSDHYWYNSTDFRNDPNSGYMYFKSNNRTIQFLNLWYTSKDKYPGKKEQDVLNYIKYDPFITNIGLSIRFLDIAYFGGICHASKDLNLVCTMHTNCCVGLDKKAHDLAMFIGDWKKYIEMQEDQRKSNPPTWTRPWSCR